MAYQAPWTVRRKTPKRHALIWPKDGKRGTRLGRLADILTNSGPDIFVATHRGRGLGWDAPTRSQWSRWDFLDRPENDPWAFNAVIGDGPRDRGIGKPFWHARRGAAQKYDFRTRKWKDGHEGMWSDVKWETGAKTKDQIPRRFRTPDGWWFTPQPVLAGYNNAMW
ncbi:hypothetical protein NA57DRAFT_77274 [Rhizodiscina lignyota]|uniref:Uncharacterized protein n=1 Tax=Rhizodiscina lignyota TaxID=1504668 RepID=A0A9P4IBK3_9PEZI|nr:hypothetical protein NA57DRAFT_77274 [Rhizodiscina lignyota]